MSSNAVAMADRLIVLMAVAAVCSLPLWMVASNGVAVTSGRRMSSAVAAGRYARKGSRLASVGSRADDHEVPGGSGCLGAWGAGGLRLGRCGMLPGEGELA